jgi:hypothetical protein
MKPAQELVQTGVFLLTVRTVNYNYRCIICFSQLHRQVSQTNATLTFKYLTILDASSLLGHWLFSQVAGKIAFGVLDLSCDISDLFIKMSVQSFVSVSRRISH